MEKNKVFYITTTLPYVNAKPHIGHALEFVRADAIARSKEKLGYEVFFNTGTDEHGMKVWEGAEKEGVDIMEYTTRHANAFKLMVENLNLQSGVHFIRTTDERHVSAAQEFWKKVADNGYIYKKKYQAKYCAGCELEKTDSELVDGKCPIHSNREIDFIDEENYFFKFSEFTQPLLDFYSNNKTFVQPDFRFNEIKAFVERGLQDFSISRVKEKMPWGIPVPGDEEQVMYVWFDALVNYISTLGWGSDDAENFGKFWEEGQTVQICGKDNLRQQSAMWQAMLMACGEQPSNTVLINGFLNGPDGRKMSKSLGNVIDPIDVVEKLGVDAVRFYILHEVSSTEDSPISFEMMKESYNAYLVNGFGNLTNRVVKMAISYEVDTVLPDAEDVWRDSENVGEFIDSVNSLNYRKAIQYLTKESQQMDEFISHEQPFKKIKVNENEAKEDVARLILNLWYVAVLLEPFLPEAAVKMQQALATKTMPETPIFPRLEN